VRLVQHEQGQQRSSTATRASARVLVVIDYLPLFLPALIVLAFGFRWASAFVVTFDF
jgi:hypothetical protein